MAQTEKNSFSCSNKDRGTREQIVTLHIPRGGTVVRSMRGKGVTEEEGELNGERGGHRRRGGVG